MTHVHVHVYKCPVLEVHVQLYMYMSKYMYNEGTVAGWPLPSVPAVHCTVIVDRLALSG